MRWRHQTQYRSASSHSFARSPSVNWCWQNERKCFERIKSAERPHLSFLATAIRLLLHVLRPLYCSIVYCSWRHRIGTVGQSVKSSLYARSRRILPNSIEPRLFLFLGAQEPPPKPPRLSSEKQLLQEIEQELLVEKQGSTSWKYLEKNVPFFTYWHGPTFSFFICLSSWKSNVNTRVFCRSCIRSCASCRIGDVLRFYCRLFSSKLNKNPTKYSF